MSDVVELFVICLIAVAALALLAKKLRVAYPIVLVFGGLLLGLLPRLPKVELNPDFIFLFFLPPLLFPAALFTSWRDFRANLRPILLLAIGLVLFTTAAVGYLAHHFMGLPLAAAFVLGAIISPPDAIAAAAIAERLRIPRRIVTVLEGESLVNDATALVAYRFAIAAVLTGSNSFSLGNAAGQFLLIAVGGIAIGVGIGWVASKFHCHVDDPPIEITVSFLTPFVAYILAERLHVSGVMSVVAAGLFLGWRTPEITNPSTRLQGGPFWGMIEFILNGFVFILIGLKLPDAVRALSGESFARLIGYALAMSFAVIAIRIAWVFPATYLPRMFKKIRDCDPPPPWQHVALVAWTGMRGVVSLASALAIPLTLPNGAAFPGRDMILFLTFVVILATLVLQGLSLPWLIRALRIEDDRSTEREEHQARLAANRAALERLKEVPEQDPERADARDRLRVEYEDRVRQLEAYQPNDGNSHWSKFSTEYENLSFETLAVERDVILDLRNRSVINDEVLRRIQHDLDLAEARVRNPE